MGCDIHMFIEYKVGDGPWTADKHHINVKDDDYEYLEQVGVTERNYNLFAALAGVRGPGPANKGLPEDVSYIIKNDTDPDTEYSDDHSHSWSTFREFKTALRWCAYELGKAKKVDPIAFEAQFPPDVNKYELKTGYPNLVAYIEKTMNDFKAELEAEKHLLGQDVNTEVDARLVYWFDN
jgi:hypothetical protein